MQILTEKNVRGVDNDCADAQQFIVIRFEDGNVSHIPRGLFRNNHDEDIVNAPFGKFFIGRDSALGVGSIAKYDGNAQSLIVGRHVRGGLRLRFLLNGQHEVRTMAMSMFSGQIRVAPQPQFGDTVLRNDLWIGDEAMILGGSVIENGCVIGARSMLPPNFRTEPFGIYLGAPAKLVGFRFTEKVREALLKLQWWDQPFDWIRQHAEAFQIDLTLDEGHSLELLAGLIEQKPAAAEDAAPTAEVR